MDSVYLAPAPAPGLLTKQWLNARSETWKLRNNYLSSIKRVGTVLKARNFKTR
jgi:hypothetical protein